MKTKSIYITLALFTLLLGACSKEEVGMYDANVRYLYIPDEEGQNEQDFTFKHHPTDIQSYDLYFDVKLAGLTLSEDKPYALEVVEKETTADAAEYSVELQQIFHAGVWKDRLKVTVHKSERIKREEVKLVLRLVPNETFRLADYMGESSKNKTLTAILTFSDLMIRPEWWNDDIVDNYLGEWGEYKYQCFIQSCDGEILDLSKMEADEKYMLCLKFKEDIKKNNWIDPATGNLLEVPVY